MFALKRIHVQTVLVVLAVRSNGRRCIRMLLLTLTQRIRTATPTTMTMAIWTRSHQSNNTSSTTTVQQMTRIWMMEKGIVEL